MSSGGGPPNRRSGRATRPPRRFGENAEAGPSSRPPVREIAQPRPPQNEDEDMDDDDLLMANAADGPPPPQRQRATIRRRRIDDEEDDEDDQLSDADYGSHAGPIPAAVLFAAVGLPAEFPPRTDIDDGGAAGLVTIPKIFSYINDGPRRPDEDIFTYRTRIRRATENMNLEHRMDSTGPNPSQFPTEREFRNAMREYRIGAQERNNRHLNMLDPSSPFHDAAYTKRWRADKRRRQKYNARVRLKALTEERTFYDGQGYPRLPTPPLPDDSGDDLYDYVWDGPITPDVRDGAAGVRRRDKGKGRAREGARDRDSTAPAGTRCTNCIKSKKGCDSSNVGVPCTRCKENIKVKNDSCVTGDLAGKPSRDARCQRCARQKKKCSVVNTGVPCDACSRAGVECVRVAVPGRQRDTRSASPSRNPRAIRSRSPSFETCQNCAQNGRVCTRNRPCAPCILWDERDLCDQAQKPRDWRPEPKMTEGFAIFDDDPNPAPFTLKNIEQDVLRQAVSQYGYTSRPGYPNLQPFNTITPHQDLRGLNTYTNQNDNRENPWDVMMDGAEDWGGNSVPRLGFSRNPTPITTAPQTPRGAFGENNVQNNDSDRMSNQELLMETRDWFPDAVDLEDPYVDPGIDFELPDQQHFFGVTQQSPSGRQIQELAIRPLPRPAPRTPPQAPQLFQATPSPPLPGVTRDPSRAQIDFSFGLYCQERRGGPLYGNTSAAKCLNQPSKTCDHIAHGFFCTCSPCHDLQNDFFRTLQAEIINNTKLHFCQECVDDFRAAPIFARGRYRESLCTCTGQLKKTWLCHQHREWALDRVRSRSLVRKQDVITRFGDGDTCPVCKLRPQDPNTGAWACISCEEFVLDEQLVIAVASP